MKQSVFEDIFPNHPFNNCEFFSQSQFRKKHLPAVTMNLCSGLVRLWYQYDNKELDFFGLLKNPNDGFLNRLMEYQKLSYYPTNTNEQSFKNLREEDKNLLLRKYNISSYEELIKLLNENQVSGLLELDLLKNYGLKDICIKGIPNDAENIVKSLIEGQNPRLSIVILRYIRIKNGQSMRFSHRMGFKLDREGMHIFFDPNAGQVMINDKKVFQNWFEQFWRHSKYRTRLSIKGVPFCSIYEMT